MPQVEDGKKEERKGEEAKKSEQLGIPAAPQPAEPLVPQPPEEIAWDPAAFAAAASTPPPSFPPRLACC